MTTEQRISRLEGAYEQVDKRLDDLNQSMGGLRSEMDSLRSEMRGEMSGLRSEMRGEMGGLRSEMNSRLQHAHHRHVRYVGDGDRGRHRALLRLFQGLPLTFYSPLAPGLPVRMAC